MRIERTLEETVRAAEHEILDAAIDEMIRGSIRDRFPSLVAMTEALAEVVYAAEEVCDVAFVTQVRDRDALLPKLQYLQITLATLKQVTK